MHRSNKAPVGFDRHLLLNDPRDAPLDLIGRHPQRHLAIGDSRERNVFLCRASRGPAVSDRQQVNKLAEIVLNVRVDCTPEEVANRGKDCFRGAVERVTAKGRLGEFDC